MVAKNPSRESGVTVYCGRHGGSRGRKLKVIDHRDVFGAEHAHTFVCPDHGSLPAVSVKRLQQLWWNARLPALSGQPAQPIVL
jgi:hypothetical protein